MTKVTKILWWMKAYMRGEEKERRREGEKEKRRTGGHEDTRRTGIEGKGSGKP